MQESSNKTFNHLKIHTQYSICEGAIKIEDLKNYCKDNKIKSLGLSDTSNLSGSLEFSENLSKSGTQPIIGTQILFNFKDEVGLLPLIAMTEIGYKKIVELSSKSYLSSNENLDPQCKLEYLMDEPEGVILLSGSINGLIGKLFNKGKFSEIEEIYNKIKNKYVDNFYIEIQRHNDQNEKYFENFNLNLSKKINLPIIATQEIYYIDKSMHDAHEALICIGQKTYLNDKNRLTFSDQHYFKSSDEMNKLFSDLPEALENNYNLPLRCSFRPVSSKPILPNISSEKSGNADHALASYSEEGLINKFLNVFKIPKDKIQSNPKFKIYKERLNHELKIITEMKYASYFLIVSDYIKWAKKNDIPVGPGRGSGAGSLVAWCLSITDLDPLALYI